MVCKNLLKVNISTLSNVKKISFVWLNIDKNISCMTLNITNFLTILASDLISQQSLWVTVLKLNLDTNLLNCHLSLVCLAPVLKNSILEYISHTSILVFILMRWNNITCLISLMKQIRNLLLFIIKVDLYSLESEFRIRSI